MATLCYGNIVNGNNGHDETDVLYLAFTGADAVPGANGAKWNAQNAVEFEASLATLGDILVKRIARGTSTTSTTTSKAPTATCTPCSWTGHCAGDDCFTSSSSSSSSSYFSISSNNLPSSSPSISSSSSSKAPPRFPLRQPVVRNLLLLILVLTLTLVLINPSNIIEVE